MSVTKFTALLFASLVSLTAACTDDSDTSSTRGATIIPVDDDGTCPAGYELEEEHGQTFCKAHGGGADVEGAIPANDDGTCPAGYELEDEHGDVFCKPHGGDDGEVEGAIPTNPDGTCPAGYELELEHGETFCKPHGGGSDDD